MVEGRCGVTDDAVQMRAPGASTTPPPRPSRSPQTPPPRWGQEVVSTEMIPPPLSAPPPPPPLSGSGERRYTLEEARKILDAQNCARDGHDLREIRRGDGTTVSVVCERCPATFEPRVLPPLPPDDELRKDMFSAGGHTSIRLTHIPTGLVATAEGGRSRLEDLRRAEQLLRARLLVAQLEREATR